MIHDAIVEVTCDGDGCNESVFVGLEWAYRNPHESSGFYDPDDKKIEDTKNQYQEDNHIDCGSVISLFCCSTATYKDYTNKQCRY